MAENAPKRHKIQSFGTLSKVFVTIICGQPKVTFLCWWCCSACFRAAPNAQKNQFLGGIIIIQSFWQLHVWTLNTFHGRNMVRRDPVFSSKKHAQGAERALLLWSKWGLRDGRRLVPSQLTYQIYFLLESVPILVPRRMMRIMQLSVENLPLHVYTSFNPGAHGLICECGGGRVCPAVGFEHKHWGAGRHLQPGQCCVPE